MFEGQDIFDLAMTRAGQNYVLGAKVHLANKDWSGPWDCAEFVSWAAYHAYHAVIAVEPPNIQVGESYSGWWAAEAKQGGAIPAAQAIGIPGAILIRQPGYGGVKIGHVAISRGDNSTIEAHSSKVGVAVLPKANTRLWSTGFLIPGVAYAKAAAGTPKPAVPKGIVRLTSPFTRGPAVKAIQEALLAKGINPGPVDEVFGNATATAVAAFQAQAGIVVDGMVGPQTRKALGLA